MKYCLTNCNIFDVNRGVWQNNKTIFVENKKISNIADKLNVQHMRSYDVHHKWIIPGLIDAHVHICHEGTPETAKYFSFKEGEINSALRATKNLQLALNSGILLLRDVGSYNSRGLKIKRILGRNNWMFPKLISCGALLSSPKGHVHEIGKEIRGINSCRNAVREEIEKGADFIKVTNDPIGLTREELTTIAEEAHKYNKIVACHAFTKKSIQLALDAKFDTIEHAAPFNQKMLKQMLKQNTIIVPTYFCAIETCKDINKSLIYKKDLPLFKKWRNSLKNNLPRAIKAGIKIATGTDAGYPPLNFNSLIEEIISLVNIGASPSQAIISATKISAEACNLTQEYGSVEKGKLANFIVLSSNPLKDIKNIKKIEFIVKDGILFKPSYILNQEY